jgi:putative transcriptional regulator
MSDKTPKAKRRRHVQYSWTPAAIRALREHMNLTQREMADELEVRQQTISEWETSAHTPHRSMQKTLSMIAERVDFKYEDSLRPSAQAAEDQG